MRASKLQALGLGCLAALLLRKGRRSQGLVLAIASLYLIHKSQQQQSGHPLSCLVRYGAEARILEKYFSSNLGIVTFRSERGDGHLKILTALSLSSLTRTSAQSPPPHSQSQSLVRASAGTKHVVFVSSSGRAALWAPAMARTLTTKKNMLDSTLVTHAVELAPECEDSLETSHAEFVRWIKRDLRGGDPERVTVVCWGDKTASLLGRLSRENLEFSSCVSLLLVNPLARPDQLFPALPFRSSLLSFYRFIFTKLVQISRVLHDQRPPLVDPAIVDFAFISGGAKYLTNRKEDSPLLCEVGVVCGDQDWWGGRCAYEKLSSSLGGEHSAPVVFLRGLGAAPHLEDPEKFAEAVLTAEFSIPQNTINPN